MDRLLEFSLNKHGISSRIDRARFSPEGMVPHAQTLDELSDDRRTIWTKILGDEFSRKVLLLTDPNPGLSFEPGQLVISGGWCAMRTADTRFIDDGLTIDPQTGKTSPITNVGQVAKFIKESIAFDQLAEAIGAPNHPQLQYVAMSESRLWSEKIVNKLGHRGMKLVPGDKDLITEAVEQTEVARHKMTERYLQRLTGNSDLDLVRVPDYAIFEDLERARDDLLARANVRPRDIFHQHEYGEFNSITLVWSMFSQPYFDLLKAKGYISPERDTFLMVVPVTHAWGDTRTGIDLAGEVQQKAGVYLQEGINDRTGLVAYPECITTSRRSVRRLLNCSEVPSISNWQAMLAETGALGIEQNGIINPVNNPLFLWGLNLLPAGSTLRALDDLVTTSQDFDQESAVIASRLGGRGDIQEAVGKARGRFIRERVLPLNEIINRDLRSLFQFVTEGIVL